MGILYLGLGTNLGEKEMNINIAVKLLEKALGKVSAISSFIETEPWGFDSKNGFVNAVLAIETDKDPFDILKITQDIEREMGRTQKSGTNYQDRIIDIDILLYEDLILDTEKLKIPHPLLEKRDFVLRPLAEIAPEFMHPRLNRTIKSLKHILDGRL